MLIEKESESLINQYQMMEHLNFDRQRIAQFLTKLNKALPGYVKKPGHQVNPILPIFINQLQTFFSRHCLQELLGDAFGVGYLIIHWNSYHYVNKVNLFKVDDINLLDLLFFFFPFPSPSQIFCLLKETWSPLCLTRLMNGPMQMQSLNYHFGHFKPCCWHYVRKFW
jgi:hypothetical protein